MGHKQYHMADDELLLVLLDAPNCWVFRDEPRQYLTLRHALVKAHESYLRQVFTGAIVKQPGDEIVVETMQVFRLWKHLDLEMPVASARQDGWSGFSSFRV